MLSLALVPAAALRRLPERNRRWQPLPPHLPRHLHTTCGARAARTSCVQLTAVMLCAYSCSLLGGQLEYGCGVHLHRCASPVALLGQVLVAVCSGAWCCMLCMDTAHAAAHFQSNPVRGPMPLPRCVRCRSPLLTHVRQPCGPCLVRDTSLPHRHTPRR